MIIMKRKILILIISILSISLASGCIGSGDDDTIVIGSKLFNEQYIVAHMAALLLEEEGFDVDVQEGLGGTMVNFEAMKKGDIDMYLEYTGTAYNVIYKIEAPTSWDVDHIYNIVEERLNTDDNVHIAASLGFRDDYAIAVKREWAEQNNVSNLTEFEAFAAEMSIGTDPEFASRQDGLPQLFNVYGYTFGTVSQMQPTLMYEAIKNNEVDAISAYTTDARVDIYGLVILEDDKGAFPPYDAILIVNDDAYNNAKVMEVLAMLQDIMDTDDMRALNYQYDEEKREARDIAYDFLANLGMI